jgi:mono/diheme cytochrome c family protein
MRLTRTVVAYVLLSWVTLALVACGGEEATGGGGSEVLGECPPGGETQAQNGQFVLFGTCVGCHGSQLVGDERLGAPVGMDFDRPEMIRQHAEAIYLQADSGLMPPPTSEVPRLSEAQIEALRIYLACGVE